MTVFGGSLNKRGTDYLRKIHEADKVVKYLEEFKEVVDTEKKQAINETIKILVNYITELGESKEAEKNAD
jgi:hypothetical protein